MAQRGGPENQGAKGGAPHLLGLLDGDDVNHEHDLIIFFGFDIGDHAYRFVQIGLYFCFQAVDDVVDLLVGRREYEVVFIVPTEYPGRL